jgi:hypothetical protein
MGAPLPNLAGAACATREREGQSAATEAAASGGARSGRVGTRFRAVQDVSVRGGWGGAAIADACTRKRSVRGEGDSQPGGSLANACYTYYAYYACYTYY